MKYLVACLFCQVVYANSSTRIAVSGKKPSWQGDLKHYQTLYKQPNYYLAGAITHYLDWQVMSLGGGVASAFYTDNGHAALRHDGEIKIDKTEETSLLLVPLRLQMTASVRPLLWLAVDATGGYEYLYASEQRITSDDSSEGGKALVSSSWRPYYFVGMSLHLSLNALERRAIAKLNRMFATRNVYLSLHLEKVDKLDDDGSDFSRFIWGGGVTFDFIE